MTDNKHIVERVLELLLAEARSGRIGPGRSYMKKELVRERMQSVVVDAVAAGEVGSQGELDGLFATMDMALGALRGVPFDAYRALSTRKGR